MSDASPELITIFGEALQRSDPAARAAYLDQVCGDQPSLRRQVEALLAAHDGAGRFLEPMEAPRAFDSNAGQVETHATAVHTPSPEPFPISITAHYVRNPETEILIAGRYTLQEKIGEGGMGEVWVAKQSEPVKRKVALKLIKPGMDSRAVLQRFEQERQALAMMDHPNIARVLDAGMTPNGQPFFVMELVNGLPLNKFCDEARLTPKERLELFVPICQAVQHAHQKGIVHRDLKPANILITMIDARPVPKVIDFGVAKATAGKLTDESMSTQFGAVVGTLEYMSPEQAGFSGEDIDTRADIYSLGVILYELLTGLRPIDAARLKKAALTEMIQIIREEEPSKPSTRLSTNEALPSLAAMRQTDPRRLMTILRGDLDWVVMKCLEKHRERRYETANALARDVRRYLDGDAVEACPPSVGYRMGKFLRRNKGPVLAASFVLLALIAGFIGTAYGLFRADRARRAEAAQRAVAVEQKTKAEAAEALAKAQRNRAEAREEQAIEAVRRFRDAVADNPELKNNPSLESLRKTLLKEPLAFFRTLRDRLQADRDTRPESLARLGQAGVDLGTLSGEIGDKQDALIAVQESLEILQRLADANPTDYKFQHNLAAGYQAIGNLLADTGNPSGAMTAFEAALAIQRKSADANPTVAKLQSGLAANLNDFSLLLKKMGRPAEALAASESALAIYRKLVDANPTVTEFQSELADIHNNIGTLLRQSGKSAAALRAYESARAIQQKLADDNPTVTKVQSVLAGSHRNIGHLSKPAAAMTAFESALAIYRKLADANPTVTEFQSGLASSHGDIGMMLREIGKPAEAIKAHESALAIREKLAGEHPEIPDYASELGLLLHNAALLEVDAGRLDSARDRLRRAIVRQKQALDSNPMNPTYRRYLTGHLDTIIVVARRLGDSEGAAEAKRELAKLRDSDPAMVALDARLSAIIEGDKQPKDNADRLRLAQRAYDKALHATAARLWAEALAADPKLGNDRQAQHRYNAACAAALAGCGKSKDDPSPDLAASAKLRGQAREWLRAEFEAWRRVSMTVEPGNKEAAAKILAHWKQNADLASIRDTQELAKLPEGEQKEWQSLWADVDALLKRTQGPKP